jgi:hypothetical protein
MIQRKRSDPMIVSDEDFSIYESYAKGAIEALLAEGRDEFDIWRNLSDEVDINIYSNGEVASATIYAVKDGLIDTSDDQEIYSIVIKQD